MPRGYYSISNSYHYHRLFLQKMAFAWKAAGLTYVRQTGIRYPEADRAQLQSLSCRCCPRCSKIVEGTATSTSREKRRDGLEVRQVGGEWLPIGDITWRTDAIASEWQARRKQESCHRERKRNGGARRTGTTIGDGLRMRR